MSALLAGLAVGSTALKVIGSNRREDEINETQERKEASDRLVRKEQAGRIRRNQIKQAQINQANVEATSMATGGPGSSGAKGASSGVQANLATNLANLNTDLATGDINAAGTSAIRNAGRPSDFELFNDIVNPGLQAGLSNSIAKAFE